MRSNFAVAKTNDMANFFHNIRNYLASKNHILRTNPHMYIPNWDVCAHKFGETIYLNAVELITDIYSEVIWTSVDTPKFRAWRDWVNRNGQRILVQLQRVKGYTVIGYKLIPQADGTTTYTFYELGEDKYRTRTVGDKEVVECLDDGQLFYVLREPTFEATGKGSHEWCEPYIKMLDAVLNGSTTIAERLGAYVVMSPKTDNFGGILTEGDKKDIEDVLQKEYGMLSRQKQIMLLNRPMDVQVVSLAAVDVKMKDKANLAILAIADRLKVPANQLSIIDGGQAKAFANGSEYREGDIAKYRTFRRLLNATFYDMATELGMQVNYTIENEPKTVQNQTIENNE